MGQVLHQVDIIRGASLLLQRVHTDVRGGLLALEELGNVLFPLKRVFVIKVDTPGPARGGHANSCDELIIVLGGAVTVEIDNGSDRADVRLSGHNEALWIQRGVLISLTNFSPDTVTDLLAETLLSLPIQPEIAVVAPEAIANALHTFRSEAQ